MIIYDEMDNKYFENENGEPCDYNYRLADDDFELLFDDIDGNFIICGTIGLWDGKRRGHSKKVFNNLREAILECNNGFDGYLCISEEDNKLYVDVSHHDGNNHLEIRELTNLGEEMWNNYCNVGEILNTENATANVEFFKKL